MPESSRASSLSDAKGPAPGARRSRTEVLIVGAGPTGLALALCLARWKVPFRLIDRATGPAQGSRAIGVQARTLELLEQHRVVDALLAAGHRGHAGNIVAGARRIIRIDFDPLDSRYPYLLFVDQSETERVLSDALASLGGTVEHGAEFVALEQSSQSVTATVQHANAQGERYFETIDAAWMVGTDGAHRSVRHKLGVPFEGVGLAGR
jgi:2-polyprenyl-6-methoxyphenol hydroxylase-like FAD-dependent oxidoreductase